MKEDLRRYFILFGYLFIFIGAFFVFRSGLILGAVVVGDVVDINIGWSIGLFTFVIGAVLILLTERRYKLISKIGSVENL